MIYNYFRHRSTPIFLVCSFLIALIIPTFYIPTSHDTAWILHTTLQLFDSSIDSTKTLTYLLFSDIILHGIPAFLSIEFHLHPLFAVKLFNILAFLFFLAINFLQIKLITKSVHSTLYFLIPLTIMAFPLWVEFGQRDQYVFFGLLTYILTVICRRLEITIPRSLCIISGLLAFLAIAIKLHYVLALIFIEIYLLYWHKSLTKLFRWESSTLAFASILFFFINIFFIPQVLSQILNDLLNFYWTYSISWQDRFLPSHIVLLFAVFLTIVFSTLPTNVIAIQKIFGLSIFGAYFAFIILGNIWAYRQYPFIGLVLVYCFAGIGYFFSTFFKTKSLSKHPAEKVIFGINAFLFLLVFKFFIVDSTFTNDFKKWMSGEKIHWLFSVKELNGEAKILADIPNMHSMFVMHTSLFPHTLVMMQDQYTWVSRYHTMWMLPAWAQAYSNPQLMPKNVTLNAIDTGINKFLHNTEEDLMAQKPDVFIIDVSKNKAFFNNLEFDYINFFNEHLPYFKKIWPDYVYYKSFTIENGKVKLNVYVRKELCSG